ncbi:type I restriction-modification system methyltransferase subunit [Beggiatoa alba B18LD]|uniref:site-specific DNA-methyltransferase (adenine-specific) n=1 Tax=Beggiatoa alba B18LD TaxID=395493 RepID=I3CD56_9GAMM|nr:DNA methyltransferase [Beggiatoa alba]EIJ41549.1 type I restriction-modification system methyltransferase subunit [Beggiatoa alba B18LD]
MPFINSRLLKKILHATEIPPAHLEILTKWRDSILNRQIYSQNETSLDSHFIQSILINILDYKDFGEDRTLWKNKPIASGNVDIALGHFTDGQDKIIAPFELKGAKTRDLDAIMAGRHKSPVQQAWEYAMDATGAQWVLVSNYVELRLYAVGYGRRVYETWDLSRLTEPLEYARLQLLLNAKQLLSGATADILRQSEQTEKEITNQLYADYTKLREKLLKTLAKDNPSISASELIHLTQKILDRILFIAFAEDKGLLPNRILAKVCETQNIFNPQPIWHSFIGLFRAIHEGHEKLAIPAYNGGLFQTDCLLDELTVNDELCQDFKALGEYDFASEVSVTVLGHIFEQSITDIEVLQKAVRGEHATEKVSKRKQDGIFYTPAYITRFIVEQAVGGWLAERKAELGFNELPILTEQDYESIRLNSGRVEYNKKIEKHIEVWKRYKTILSQIKVLDPACGSGAFLSEVFDYLYQEGQTINERLTTLHGGQAHLFRWDTHILANNLYGVDINNESVEITKLSLWLKTANKQEKLTYLDNNIKCGNSLIDDVTVAGHHAFSWHIKFAEIMQAGGFDVVVGNPPYIPIESIPETTKQYLKIKFPYLERKFDLSTVFTIKGLSLLNQNGYLSYISSVTWQTGENYNAFRKNLLTQYGLLVLVNLPFDVFPDAYVDTGIYLFSKNISSSYKVFCFNKQEKISHLDLINYQLVETTLLASTNYKIILNIKNYYLLNKIKTNQNYVKLGSITQSTQGLSKSCYDLSPVKTANNNIPFLESGIINRYKLIITQMSYTHLDNNSSLFQYYNNIEKILIRRIISRQNRLLVSYVNQQIIFKKDVNPFILKNTNFYTKYLLCILASKLISYLYLNSSSIAVKDDFRQTTLAELREIPIIQIPLSQQSIFVEYADMMLIKVEQLHQTVSKTILLINTEFRLAKISKSLENWYTLDFTDFLTELTKANVKLSLAQKSDWMDYFNQQKQQALILKQEIEQTDKAIDQLVYALYGLTTEEIQLVEDSFNF